MHYNVEIQRHANEIEVTFVSLFRTQWA
jgi:hypothetical protein